MNLTESLVDVFIDRFERLILSGQIRLGEKLPSERDLSRKMDVSRPVVHEGLLYLSVKGLVTLKPRSGWMVNDYRKHGSLTLLSSLFEYGEGRLDKEVASSMLGMRLLVETETAKLAACNRTDKDLKEIMALINTEEKLSAENREEMVQLDFQYHLSIAAASGNLVYPLLLNSCKAVYTNLTGIFYQKTDLHKRVVLSHRSLYKAIKAGDSAKAGKIMETMLEEGEKNLRRLL